MTANELPADQLADLLDEIPVGDFESLDHHHFTRQAATMLRKQQAEIESLKSEMKELKLFRLHDLDVILKQQAEIEALIKDIPYWENINKPNPFIGMSEDPNYKPLPPNSGLGGSALKKGSEK
jgi:hypothetical protein